MQTGTFIENYFCVKWIIDKPSRIISMHFHWTLILNEFPYNVGLFMYTIIKNCMKWISLQIVGILIGKLVSNFHIKLRNFDCVNKVLFIIKNSLMRIPKMVEWYYEFNVSFVGAFVVNLEQPSRKILIKKINFRFKCQRTVITKRMFQNSKNVP